MKRINPYQRLLNEVKDWAHKAKHRRMVSMFFIPKDRLNEGWNLTDVYERAQAAKQLGYDVVIETDGDGILIKYREQCPEIPYNWRY